MLRTSKADRYLGKAHAKEQMKGFLPCQGPFNSLSIANEAKESTTFFLWFTAELIHLLNTPLLLGFGKLSQETERPYPALSVLDSPRKRRRHKHRDPLHVVLLVQRMAENWSVCRWTLTKEFWICQEAGNGPISWSQILRHSPLKSE